MNIPSPKCSSNNTIKKGFNRNGKPVIKCKGCGVCVASCPSNAIIQNHFTRNQILSEIRALRPWESVKFTGDD